MYRLLKENTLAFPNWAAFSKLEWLGLDLYWPVESNYRLARKFAPLITGKFFVCMPDKECIFRLIYLRFWGLVSPLWTDSKLLDESTLYTQAHSTVSMSESGKLPRHRWWSKTDRSIVTDNFTAEKLAFERILLLTCPTAPPKKTKKANNIIYDPLASDMFISLTNCRGLLDREAPVPYETNLL